jgi:hypothetical protein
MMPFLSILRRLARLRQRNEAAEPRSATRPYAAPLFSLSVVLAWLLLVMTAPPCQLRHGSPSGSEGDLAADEEALRMGAKDSGEFPFDSHRLADTIYVERLIGHWKRTFFGEQSLHVCPDGTATVVAHPDAPWSFALGNRLEVRLRWEVKNGYLIYHFTGGHPETGIRVARSIWGDRWSQRIDRLDSKRLILLWADGDRDEWHRATSPRTP